MFPRLRRRMSCASLDDFGVSMFLLGSDVSRETGPGSVPLVRRVFRLKMVHELGNNSLENMTHRGLWHPRYETVRLCRA